MATRRQEQKAATRAKVLEAARIGFNTLGYERTTIRDIARMAEMSTGAVFASFSGKEALYRELYGHAPVTPEAGRALLLAARIAMNEPGPHAHQLSAAIAQVEEA